MLAHAFLATATAHERTHAPAADDLIPLTCNEIQHLFTTLATQPTRTAAHRLRWFDRRRRHQARPRPCHYQRQAVYLP
ncbi:hypothetical protein OK006_7810 [Actinobacteria bacterium OK006]|nr:hypothetical protein OK006_7810 [Actinobacteria bacterium OK006]